MKTTSTYQKIKCLLFLSISSLTVFAQEFSMDAEYRPRAEVRSGYSEPLLKSLKPDLLMMQRVRLNADYRSKLINATLSIQDARIFGEANEKGQAINNKVEAPKLGIYEAWAELNLPKGISFRIGRQAISYDDQRLFSKCNWSNTGSSHDLALLTYKYKDFKANLGYAYNNSLSNPLTSEYYYGTSSFYKNLGYLWIYNRFGDSGLRISAIAVAEGFQAIEDQEKNTYYSFSRYTYGGNIEFKRKDFPLSAYVTAYGQSGKDHKKKLQSYLLALKLNYEIAKSVTITGGMDYYSGTAAKDSTATHSFSGLYGSNHSFNGAMDYWSPAKLPLGGLVDLYLSAQYTVCPKVTLLGTFRSFRLAKEMAIGGDKKGLGHEIDLDLTYQFCEFATIKTGWSTYLDRELTKKVKKVEGPTRFSQWAYISLAITPHLFTYKKK